MAARRLIMVLLVLLLVSSLAAALIPIEQSHDSSSTTTTTTAAAKPSGRLLIRRIDAGARKPEEIRMHVGDQLQLSVDSDVPDQVEIPALDQIEPVDNGSPARFDLLVDQARSYPVRLVEADKTVGRIVVTARNRASESGRRS